MVVDSSETDLESPNCGKPRYLVTFVNGVGGVGDILQTGENVGVATDAAGQFHVQQSVVLAFDIIGYLESPNTLQVSGDLQIFPQSELSAEIILISRSARKVIQRSVEITVRCENPQIVNQIALGRDFNSFVYESSGVDIFVVNDVDHVASTAVVSGDFSGQIA